MSVQTCANLARDPILHYDAVAEFNPVVLGVIQPVMFRFPVHQDCCS
jgi:hypothetical protein